MAEGLKIYSAPIRFRKDNYQNEMGALLLPIQQQIVDNILEGSWGSKINGLVSSKLDQYNDFLTLLKNKCSFYSFDFQSGGFNGYASQGYKPNDSAVRLRAPVQKTDSTDTTGPTDLTNINNNIENWISSPFTIIIPEGYKIVGVRYRTEEAIETENNTQYYYVSDGNVKRGSFTFSGTYNFGGDIGQKNAVVRLLIESQTGETPDFGIFNSKVKEANFKYFTYNLQFSSDKPYNFGDLIIYNNNLYGFTTAHQGAWSTSHVTETLSEIFRTNPFINPKMLSLSVTSSTMTTVFNTDVRRAPGYLFLYNNREIRKVTRYLTDSEVSTDSTIQIGSIINNFSTGQTLNDIKNDLYRHIVGKRIISDFSSTLPAPTSGSVIATTNGLKNGLYVVTSAFTSTPETVSDFTTSKQVRAITLIDLDNKIQGLDTSVVTLTSSYETLDTSVSDLNANYNTLSGQVGTLEGSCGSLGTRVTSLEGEMTTILNYFASAYSSTTTYSSGDIFIYEDNLKRATAAIAAEAEITSANTENITIAQVIKEIKNAIDTTATT